MGCGIDFPYDFLNLSFLINDDRVAIGIFVALHFISLGNFFSGIDEEREGELELGLKGLMARGIIEAHPQDLRVGSLEFRIFVTKIARLDRAAGGIILGVKIKDDIFFAPKVLSIKGVALLVGGAEFRGDLPFLNGHGTS